jgi:hypothetical protein
MTENDGFPYDPRREAIGKTLNVIAGYLRLRLTELERQYLHKLIAEEYAQLERLETAKRNRTQASRPRPHIKVQESA